MIFVEMFCQLNEMPRFTDLLLMKDFAVQRHSAAQPTQTPQKDEEIHV